MWLAYPNEGYQVHSVAKDPKHWSKAVRTTWGALQKLPRNIPELLGLGRGLKERSSFDKSFHLKGTH